MTPDIVATEANARRANQDQIVDGHTHLLITPRCRRNDIHENSEHAAAFDARQAVERLAHASAVVHVRRVHRHHDLVLLAPVLVPRGKVAAAPPAGREVGVRLLRRDARGGLLVSEVHAEGEEVGSHAGSCCARGRFAFVMVRA